MAMDAAQIIAAVLLGVFSSLFIVCLIVAQIRQTFHAKRKHSNWSARYRSRAQQKLENKKRIWAMFGLTYNDDVRQSDDEDDEDEDVRESKFSGYRPGAAYVKCASPDAQPPPPPYTAGTADVCGLRSALSSPPQRPERFHDNRKDEGIDYKIVSPTPQRHFQLRAPELVAPGPLELRRSDTIRSMRRYPTPPVAPEQNSFEVNQFSAHSELSNSSVEPPVSPRRLDSISRRRNDEG